MSGKKKAGNLKKNSYEATAKLLREQDERLQESVAKLTYDPDMIKKTFKHNAMLLKYETNKKQADGQLLFDNLRPKNILNQTSERDKSIHKHKLLRQYWNGRSNLGYSEIHGK